MRLSDIYLGLTSVFFLIAYLSPDKIVSILAYPTGMTTAILTIANVGEEI
jgi:hypothetical protein